MQVTKIIGEQQIPFLAVKAYITEVLQWEYDYYMAQKLLRFLLDTGLISAGEFNKITEKNARLSLSIWLRLCHPAIISHEEYDRANAVLRQRGKEKGNGRDTEKYQNRYCFSNRIQCGECGGTWKRRIHYKPSGSYIAWCCANHLADKNSCSMKYITDSALKRAFVTMMNKLVFGHRKVLSPLLHSLRG